MRLWTLYKFSKELRGKEPVDIDNIQSMGLLAVKLGQICALRPDLIDPDRCSIRQLKQGAICSS